MSGGTGTPKLIGGFRQLLRDEDLNVIVNTSDDFIYHGLYVSPDVDTVTYLFAGVLDESKYWGIVNDSFRAHEMLCKLNDLCWFHVGDLDLAIHVYRTMLLNMGYSLTQATKAIAGGLGVKANVLPMCNEHVETHVLTDQGDLHIQEYLVKYRCRPRVYGLRFEGISNAKLTSDVARVVRECDFLVIGPSNPVNSIGPILMVDGLREMIKRQVDYGKKVVAVSPIIGSKAISGPAHIFLEAMGYEPTPLGVAEYYEGVITDFIIDERDQEIAGEIESRVGVRVHTSNILIDDKESKRMLAEKIIRIATEASK